VYYSLGDVDEVMSAEANVSAEKTIAANLADKTHLYLTLGNITGTNYKIGAAIKLRVKRIASTGTEPANDPFLAMVGLHYQIDAIGSSSQTSK
jgi:hypothetical protein